MKIKISTLLTLAIASIFALSSCNKIKEATQRDIAISPDGVDFVIPVVNTTNEGSAMGTLQVNMNLDALIKEKASKFGISNVKNVRITGVKIKLNNTDDANNCTNLENLTAKIKLNTTETVVASIVNNTSTNKTELTIPITAGSTELKSFVTANSFSYVLTGKARTVTTKALNATATFTYTLTVGL